MSLAAVELVPRQRAGGLLRGTGEGAQRWWHWRGVCKLKSVQEERLV